MSLLIKGKKLTKFTPQIRFWLLQRIWFLLIRFHLDKAQGEIDAWCAILSALLSRMKISAGKCAKWLKSSHKTQKKTNGKTANHLTLWTLKSTIETSMWNSSKMAAVVTNQILVNFLPTNDILAQQMNSGRRI